MNPAAIVLLMILTAIPMISPRIPPFIGYFLCGVVQDLGLIEMPCGPNERDGGSLIPDIRGNAVINLFRVIGGITSMVIYIPAVWSSVLTIVYEVMPSLVFCKDSFLQFKEEAWNVKNGSNFDVILRKYKQLQVIIIIFNEIYEGAFFQKVMAFASLSVISTGYFILTTYHVHPLVLPVGAFITLAQYFTVFIVFDFASKVWTTSVAFNSAWRRNPQLSQRPLTRKYGISMQILKVKIGSNNFVERNTPFAFVSFCIEQTVSLVLLNRE
jgi:hypothetical protein